jgi:AraC-like DNA-binding protein
MPSSNVRSFTDPDSYAAAIRQGMVEMTVTGRGQFAAQLIRIDLHRLWMQRFAENRPRIAHIESPGKRAVVSFQTRPGPSLSFNGVDLLPTNIIRNREGGEYLQYSSGAIGFAGMSLTVEDMVSAGAAIAGCDLSPPDKSLILTPPPPAVAKLQRLHAAAGHLAETTPEILAHPEAARGLEQSLVEAMVACLTAPVTGPERSAQRRHEVIMRRFRRVVEEHPDQALYLPEICRAIGASDRSLRTCCQEHLGMSPKQYLLARRMHLARRDLSRAVPDSTTVTDVASRYGFWQFGYFARAYRSQFGELPSATLKRPPGQLRDADAMRPWAV